MMIANKQFNNKVITEVEENILRRENIEPCNYIHDTHLQICNEDLYEFVDLVFTLAGDYEAQTTEEINWIVEECYQSRRYIFRLQGEYISFTSMNYAEMRTIYETVDGANNIQNKHEAGHI